MNDVVLFLGAKDQDTLQYYYSAAEMVVMPSRLRELRHGGAGGDGLRRRP